MKQLVREPLVHFLAIGAVLFGLYRIQSSQAVRMPSNRIDITAGDIEQMRAIFFRQRQRPPSEEELKGFIDARIYEEVLYREALAMGLDRDDTIVRRRLAQKFEFLTDDLSDPGNPSETELAEFFKAHPERYQQASRLSFEHIYFSAGKRGNQIEQDARNGLASLRAGLAATAIAEMGDAFLLEQHYQKVTPQEIEKIFGPSFSAELIKLPLREWQGPIDSSYGLHLVKVDDHETSRAASLNVVREQVTRDWLDARRRQIKEAAFKKLRERYDVVIDEAAFRATVIAQGGSAREGDR